MPVYLDFTHDTQLASAVAVMGLLQDKLVPTDYPQKDRLWNAAHIVPMGARMVVERLTCKNKPDKYVRVVLNDAVLPLSCLKNAAFSSGKEACVCWSSASSMISSRVRALLKRRRLEELLPVDSLRLSKMNLLLAVDLAQILEFHTCDHIESAA